LNLEVVAQAAGDFCLQSPLNVVNELDSLRIVDQPLIGIAWAGDPLFDELKIASKSFNRPAVAIVFHSMEFVSGTLPLSR
jgi:hypothetical protein